MASRVTETTKLKSLMQEPELRVKPELQEVQVSGLPWQVRQLVEQAVQFWMDYWMGSPSMVPGWVSTKPLAQKRQRVSLIQARQLEGHVTQALVEVLR